MYNIFSSAVFVVKVLKLCVNAVFQPSVDVIDCVVLTTTTRPSDIADSHLGRKARQESSLLHQLRQVLQGRRHRRQRGEVQNVRETSRTFNENHVQPGS